MSLEDVPHEVRAALDAIAEERTRQLAVWGVQHLPNGTAASKANRAKRDSFRPRRSRSTSPTTPNSCAAAAADRASPASSI